MKRTILGSTFALGLLAASSLAGCTKREIVDETTAPCTSEEKSDVLVDITAGNGVIHMVGAEILPEPAPSPQEPATNPQEPASQPQQPALVPQEPASQPQEPGSVPEEPAAPPEKKPDRSIPR